LDWDFYAMQASAQYPNGLFVDGNELMTWCELRNVAGPSAPYALDMLLGFRTPPISAAS
jgi:hypothetical protein